MRPLTSRHALTALVLALALSVGCGSDPQSPTQPGPDDADVADLPDVAQDARDATSTHDAVDATDADDDVSLDTQEDTPPLVPPFEGAVPVRVTLDGAPAADTRVVQGGTDLHWRTDDDGLAWIAPDRDVIGEQLALASHPQARIKGATIPETPPDAPLEIALTRFERDNPRYAFQDPGEPERRPNTSQCGHCHQTINDAWFASPHRTSASNPIVHDLYAGTAAAYTTPEACAQAGGRWVQGVAPGSGERVDQCAIGAGLLPTLNPDCASADAPCAEVATDYGGCASCHAPAINGTLGGRDLLEARDTAYDYGVSCDVCHRVEAVDLTSHEPGVAGRLRLHRPSETSPSPGLGAWLPLTFGPSHDSPNPRMGSVQRDHYRDGSICAGCHQHDQPALSPDLALDPARWPDGRLPVQSTWAEWEASPMRDAAPCPSCHMPPNPTVLNGADLQRFPLAEVGVQGGWHRPPGSVRHHSWVGPRQPESRMLQLAAALHIQTQRDPDDGTLTVQVTTRNVGPGHALPTGEPSRAMLMRVEATCEEGGAALVATGGDALPAWAGALDQRTRDQGWERWPGAQVGDVLRAVRRTGDFHDYEGFGPFGDGRFDARAKGLAVEHVAGAARVTAVSPDGTVTLDGTLPADADLIYRTRAPAPLNAETSPAQGWAGAPGFAFARVMRGSDGALMVPHFLAVDVASDNRLLPGKRWTSTHRFDASACANPRARAVLLYRPQPLALARERGWTLNDTIMAQERR